MSRLVIANFCLLFCSSQEWMPGLIIHWIQNANQGVPHTSSPDGGGVQNRSTLYDSGKRFLDICQRLVNFVVTGANFRICVCPL